MTEIPLWWPIADLKWFSRNDCFFESWILQNCFIMTTPSPCPNQVNDMVWIFKLCSKVITFEFWASPPMVTSIMFKLSTLDTNKILSHLSSAVYDLSYFPESKTILQGTVEGGRKRGRKGKSWHDNVKEWSTLNMPELLSQATDRAGWRRTFVSSSADFPQRWAIVKEIFIHSFINVFSAPIKAILHCIQIFTNNWSHDAGKVCHKEGYITQTTNI